jgi:hypothetical protein
MSDCELDHSNFTQGWRGPDPARLPPLRTSHSQYGPDNRAQWCALLARKSNVQERPQPTPAVHRPCRLPLHQAPARPGAPQGHRSGSRPTWSHPPARAPARQHPGQVRHPPSSKGPVVTMRLGFSLTQGSRRCPRAPIVQLTSPPLHSPEASPRGSAARFARPVLRTPAAPQPAQDASRVTYPQVERLQDSR